MAAGDRELTYRELNALANRLANRLLSEGMASQEIVGLMAGRGANLIVGIVGILKAGGAYLPLDPDSPEKRKQFMLADSGVRLLVIEDGIAADGLFDGDVITIDDGPGAAEFDENPEVETNGGNLAYVIYTSGTTGEPKGTMIDQHSVHNLVIGLRDEVYQRYDARLRVCLLAPVIFDASVQQIFASLLLGHTLCVVPDEVRTDGRKLLAFYRDQGIEISDGTPTHLRILLEAQKDLKIDIPVKHFIIGGEAMAPELVRDFLKYHRGTAPLVTNVYGPTECCVDTTAFTFRADDIVGMKSMPIGAPMCNAQIYILDSARMPAPVGVPGEICIGGSGVSRGYLNRPELNSEKFVDNPFRAGSRMYRSGDLGRWLEDGNIEFLGRADDQLKVRGFRIEPGEIEARLREHPAVREAVVIATGSGSDKQLAAYLVTGEELDVTALRSYLGEHLPDYMVPSFFVPLDKIPLTPNGKLDRKALPDPSQEALGSGEEYVAPRNGEEKILAEVWAGVLKKERVGIHDNYFALGGDSIKAIQVMARLARKGLKLEIRDIFQAPTIAELAGRMTRQASVVSQEAVSGQMPLTAIQRWFFEHFKGTEHHYNQAVLLKTEKPLDEGPLRQVLEGLQTHHDALRMRFNLDIGTVIQNNSGPDHPVSLEVFDISGCTDPASEIEQIAGKIQAGIDLENGPLMKAALFHLDDSDRLLLAIHHLVVDGVSWRILLEDLATGYGQLAAGQRLSFPDKSHSFREWAGKVQEFARSPELLAQIPYWLKTEKHEIAPLPKDNPEGGNRYGDSGSAGFILDERQTSALLEKAGQAYSTEINDLLLTALAQAVSRWSEQADVAIMLEGHGREKIVGDLDISRTVGWFTSMFPVILEITDPGDLRQNIRRVKESLHMVPNRGIGYDILRFISDADSASPLGTGCRPEISFNYLGQFDGIGGDNLFAPAAESTGNHAAPDALRPHTLDVGGIVSGNRLSMQIQYSGQQYQSETIGELMSLFEKELLNLIEHCNNRTAPEKTPADFTCPEISLDEYDSLLGSLSLDPGQVDNIYRLTPLQEGILFYHLYNPDADTYFVQLGLRIEGRLDTTLFTESWRKAAARHDILRTVFHFRNSSQPLQVVLKYLEPEILVDDLREMSAAEQEKHIAGLKTSDRQRGFDLEHGPMLRINLLRLGDTEFELIFSNHHLLMDGWSLPVVFGEVLDIYQAMLENRTPVLPGKQSFSRYIGWLMGRDRDTAASFWQDYLSGYEQEIRLPGSKPAGHQAAEYDYRQLNLELDEATTTRFNDLAAAHNATPSSLLQAVWGVLLARLNNTDDVVFGATVSGRTEEIDGIENMVGMFINTVPVRVRYQRESTFADLLKKIQADSIEARQHHYFPLADIQSHSRLKHDLINHILVFENFPLDEKLADSRESRVGDIAFRITDVFEQTNYDLNFIIVPAKKLLIKTEYNGNAYEEKALGRLLAQFKMLIGEVLTDPEQAIGALDILSPEERNKVVEDFNGTAVAYTEGKSVVDLFDEQAARTPDAVAVVSDGLELTYRELNVRANRLAHYLTNDLGVKSGDIVGLLVERSHQVPVGMLGILKAGAAYLPLDPDYPQSRLDYIAGDNGCRVIVSQENLKDRVNADVRFIDIEEICSGDSAPENLQAEIGPDDISYVIYTSGSTGQPKGVLGTHRCLANLIQWQIDQIGGGYRTVQYAALSFDVSVQEILYSLISGGVLHMIPAALRLEFRQLAAFIGEQQIELITLPFSALNLLFEDGSGIGFVHCLKHVITSGEQLQVTDSLRRYLDNHPDVMLHNQYGPSETHVVTSFSLSAARGNISPLPPIGKPVANTGIYILDSELRPTPLGVAGEIYIGGAHVCRGYLGRPELTGEKFLDSPFVMGDRLYRTGDLGRWLEDGNIEFLGRADNQLKVRGFRIEPGEIEARLRSHPAVREAAVVATGPGSDKELAAYLVADQELDASDLRSYLGEHLPDYMIPAYFVQLDKIPLTPSGKLDRRALPSPDTGQRALTGTYLTPRNELERKIAAAWESVLGLERVGVQDNFFELGGHSLKATRLVSQLQRELELEISLRDIFQMPTVAALAKVLEQRGASIYKDIPTLKPAANYPLSHAQRRLWVLDQMEGSSAQYNMPATLLFEGSLDIRRPGADTADCYRAPRGP